jgi:phosphoribosyl-ATP pyrophosphohydrolase
MTDVLDEVYAVIADRKANPKQDSYTTSLYNDRKGLDKVLEKIGEESTELIIAAKNGGEKEIIGECADLYFHTMVLLAAKDIPLEKVKEEFERRREKLTPRFSPGYTGDCGPTGSCASK